MQCQIRKELIVKTTLDMLQNILPTNIMENLDRLSEEEDSTCNTDFLDEEKFFYEHLTKRKKLELPARTEPPAKSVPTGKTKIQSLAKNDALDNSLTYFDIVEQEMMQSLPVTRENIELFQDILNGFDDFNSISVSKFNLQKENQLTNILFHALMSNEASDITEQNLGLESGTVNKVLQILCKIIAQKKNAFIAWPNKRTIEKNVREFERYDEYGYFEFYNVFGAVGTLELYIEPAIENCLAISSTDSLTYTPIKWQCSCDTNGILQSSFVMIPTIEKETKNSYIFEVNPINTRLDAMKSDETYLVADETLTLFPYLLTPHEKLIIHAEQHNRALESKRKIIDKTFAMIQSRFLVLARIELHDAESICNLIDTVGILHNYLVIHDDPLYVDK